MSRSRMISFDDFARVDIRVGRIVEAERFPEARKPAFKLRIDFGPELGVKKSSAQLTTRYQPDDLNRPPGARGRQLSSASDWTVHVRSPDARRARSIRGGGAGGAGARGAAGRAAVLGRGPHRHRGTRYAITAAESARRHADSQFLRAADYAEHTPERISSSGPRITRTHADNQFPGPRTTRTNADNQSVGPRSTNADKQGSDGRAGSLPDQQRLDGASDLRRDAGFGQADIGPGRAGKRDVFA